jgi:hypothetical protein
MVRLALLDKETKDVGSPGPESLVATTEALFHLEKKIQTGNKMKQERCVNWYCPFKDKTKKRYIKRKTHVSQSHPGPNPMR